MKSRRVRLDVTPNAGLPRGRSLAMRQHTRAAGPAYTLRSGSLHEPPDRVGPPVAAVSWRNRRVAHVSRGTDHLMSPLVKTCP